MIKYQKDTDNIVTLRMDMKDRKVNIINHKMGQVFVPVLEHLKIEKEKGQLRGVILTSEKDTFLAGGDLEYLYKNYNPQEIFEYSEKLKSFFRALELPGVPVVAAINGTALGVGFELPLACHYKIAIDNNKISLGLPEVTLGLMPGSGGNIRMLWMLGIEKAFHILSTGKRYKPKEALEAGLIDELAKDRKDMMSKAKKWLMSNPEGRQPWDRNGYQIPNSQSWDSKVSTLVPRLIAELTKKHRNHFPAPKAILHTLVEGAKVDFDTACRIESRNFTQLLMRPESRNMVKAYWFDLLKIKGGTNRPKGFGKFRPKKVGIIGAGLMGSGIAYVCAKRKMEVILKDISIPVAERGKAFSEKQLEQIVEKGLMKEKDKQKILARIHPTENAEDFESCDLVIEAVFENQVVKEKVIKEANKHIDEYTFIASNTSLIPINTLAKSTVHPDNFIGLHFFSPVENELLVEIVKGDQTSNETIAKAFDFVRSLKKIPIIVKDNPGFYAARVQNTYILEAITMLAEGIPAIVIEHMGIQAGMPMGGLEMADVLSLKVVRRAERQAAEHFGKKYTDHPALSIIDYMTETLGRSGKFNGAGFYHYENNEKVGIWENIQEHYPNKENYYNEDELKERLLMVQALEAARCLQEGIVSSVQDANMGSILGWQFPSFKGGVLHYINDYGIVAFVEKCKSYKAKHGQRFKVPKILLKMMKEQTVFG